MPPSSLPPTHPALCIADLTLPAVHPHISPIQGRSRRDRGTRRPLNTRHSSAAKFQGAGWPGRCSGLQTSRLEHWGSPCCVSPSSSSSGHWLGSVYDLSLGACEAGRERRGEEPPSLPPLGRLTQKASPGRGGAGRGPLTGTRGSRPVRDSLCLL